jgi:hypothetical protein
MAKGQKRSNRELKKPKQDKAKAPAGAATATGWSTLDKQQNKEAGKKK